MTLPQEEAKEIMRATKFRKEDVRRWYKKFMRDYPTGQMERENFRDVFGKVYKSGPMSDRIFAKLDRNHDGSISFSELMVALSVTMMGSEKEKLEWAFEVFDEDGNGQISLDELSEILRGIDENSPDMDGDHRDEGRRLRIETVFKLVDTDSNGFLSRDEFMEGMRSHPTFSKLLSMAPTSKKSDTRVRRNAHADCPRSSRIPEKEKWRHELACDDDL